MDKTAKILYNPDMGKNTIGIYINFLTPERKLLLEESAKSFGYETRFIENEIQVSDIEDCEILFGQIPPEMLKYALNLKWLQCSFAGVDKYTDETLYPNGDVILTNASGSFGVTIAEHIICVLLMLMRHIPEYTDMISHRIWGKINKIDSIYGSTIALIGLGDIGSEFAKRAKAMGADIIGIRNNINIKPDYCSEIYPLTELNYVASKSDVVISSLPKTNKTDNLFDKEFFANMKKGSYFVNVGRGNSVDEHALFEALSNGHLSGAALDVFQNEPLNENHFLYSCPNLIITPHCSGDTSLGLTCDKITEIFLQNLKLYSKGLPLTNMVDRKKGY